MRFGKTSFPASSSRFFCGTFFLFMCFIFSVRFGFAVEGGMFSPPTRQEKRVEVFKKGDRLQVRNAHGSIHLQAWDREELSLLADIKDRDCQRVEIKVGHQQNTLNIEVVFPKQPWMPFGMGSYCRCDMTLSVPARLTACLGTLNGEISVKGVRGYLHCMNTHGNMTLQQVGGEAHLQSVNGHLHVGQSPLCLEASTTNGYIHLEGVTGGIACRTVNGNIAAHGLEGGGKGIDLQSTNGGLRVALGQATGYVWAESVNGAVEAEVVGAQPVQRKRNLWSAHVPGRNQCIFLKSTNGKIQLR